ncbi:MAG TPA: PilZ domain-containing protein [Blastocatellia bacterium]|nr:PilZ domain-containing protein [Blastocatellia bacterium]
MEPTRRFPRLTLQTELWLRQQDGEFIRTNDKLTVLSEGGCFIETSLRYPVGSTLHLRFKLPRATAPITCVVVVRNTGGGTGLGVEFTWISPEDRHQIKSFVDRQLSARP